MGQSRWGSWETSAAKKGKQPCRERCQTHTKNFYLENVDCLGFEEANLLKKYFSCVGWARILNWLLGKFILKLSPEGSYLYRSSMCSKFPTVSWHSTNLPDVLFQSIECLKMMGTSRAWKIVQTVIPPECTLESWVSFFLSVTGYAPGKSLWPLPACVFNHKIRTESSMNPGFLLTPIWWLSTLSNLEQSAITYDHLQLLNRRSPPTLCFLQSSWRIPGSKKFLQFWASQRDSPNPWLETNLVLIKIKKGSWLGSREI